MVDSLGRYSPPRYPRLMTPGAIFETKWSELLIVCPSCGDRGHQKDRWVTNARVAFRLVEDVIRSFDFLEAGDTVDDCLYEFPTVSREQALSALQIAKEALQAIANSHR